MEQLPMYKDSGHEEQNVSTRHSIPSGNASHLTKILRPSRCPTIAGDTSNFRETSHLSKGHLQLSRSQPFQEALQVSRRNLTFPRDIPAFHETSHLRNTTIFQKPCHLSKRHSSLRTDIPPFQETFQLSSTHLTSPTDTNFLGDMISFQETLKLSRYLNFLRDIPAFQKTSHVFKRL